MTTPTSTTTATVSTTRLTADSNGKLSIPQATKKIVDFVLKKLQNRVTTSNPGKILSIASPTRSTSSEDSNKTWPNVMIDDTDPTTFDEDAAAINYSSDTD